MCNIVDFNSKITLETGKGEVYVFTNKDLPKHVLRAIDVFCDQVEDSMAGDDDYSDLLLNKEGDDMKVEIQAYKHNELEELIAERDTLAFENKNLAEFIKYNDSTLTDAGIGDIAWGSPAVWDRFINESANLMLEQNKTIRELRCKLARIENICKDSEEEE